MTPPCTTVLQGHRAASGQSMATIGSGYRTRSNGSLHLLCHGHRHPQAQATTKAKRRRLLNRVSMQQWADTHSLCNSDPSPTVQEHPGLLAVCTPIHTPYRLADSPNIYFFNHAAFKPNLSKTAASTFTTDEATTAQCPLLFAMLTGSSNEIGKSPQCCSAELAPPPPAAGTC